MIAKRTRQIFCALALGLALGGCGAETLAPVELKRPGQGQVATAAVLITVSRGDTLYEVSQQHGVPLRALIEENRLQPPYTIRPGQRLRLPRVTVHVVAVSESLYSISRRYQIDSASLARTNNIRPPYTLQVGQKLALPAGAWIPLQTESAGQAVARAAPAPESEPPLRTPGRFAWPLQGEILVSFGPQSGGLHNDGINIRAAAGTPVRAADAGVVAYVGNQLRGLGNLILIRHDGGWVTAYAHNEQILVRRGQQVQRGETVGRAGATGSVSTPQLHFEIRKGTRAVNPVDLLGGEAAALSSQPRPRFRPSRPARS